MKDIITKMYLVTGYLFQFMENKHFFFLIIYMIYIIVKVKKIQLYFLNKRNLLQLI